MSCFIYITLYYYHTLRIRTKPPRRPLTHSCVRTIGYYLQLSDTHCPGGVTWRRRPVARYYYNAVLHRVAYVYIYMSVCVFVCKHIQRSPTTTTTTTGAPVGVGE